MAARDDVTHSRRALMRLAAAAAAAAPVGAAAAQDAGDDAELLALCDFVLALDAEHNRLFRLQCAAEAAGDEAVGREYSDRQVETVPDLHAAEARIASIPASTEAGKRARARVMLVSLEYNSDGTPCTEDALAYAMCQDALAGAVA